LKQIQNIISSLVFSQLLSAQAWRAPRTSSQVVIVSH